MLETFLINTLLLNESEAEVLARLLRVRLRGQTDTQIIYLLDQLARGYGARPTGSRWVSNWDAVFTQMGRGGHSPDEIVSVVRYLCAGATGPQIQQLFDNYIADGVHSDHIADLMLFLMNGPNGLHGSDGVPCIMALGAAPLSLRPRQVRAFLTALENAGLNPEDVLAIQQFLTLHGAAALANTVMHERTNKLVNLATSIDQCALGRAQIVNFFGGPYAPLNNVQVLNLALDMPFRFVHDLLGHSGMPALIHGGLADCNNLLSNMILFLNACRECLVSNACIVRIFAYFPHVPKRNMSCHGNLVDFIRLTHTARSENKANGRNWAEVLNLVDQFVASGRRNAGVAVGNGAVINYGLPSGRTLRCNSERRLYFLRAHTLRYCDFSIIDRTKDDISFWPANTVSFNWITLLIQNQLCVGGNDGLLGQICSDAEGGNYSCQFVGVFEVGVISQGHGIFPLMHFLPTANHLGVVVVHKGLLAAIAKLFT